ncbi:lipopolysaccharide biosynthesis protein [Methanothrix soehngenii]|uniref:lipopolysaccharide biosynthesis protein n=1 Tax=Methanothrix soehngenii TaxID=2223 RepID=UPI002356205D|nr:oligosaccharide flippase family protein [Methanothrix soehngenii]
MNADEIIQKSTSGAKWTVILSSIALPLGYATNIILGRISPEALGVYGLLNIFILSVTTFLLFGGGNVIIKYLPEIDNDKKVSFLATYTLIVFLITMLAIGLILCYPQILKILNFQAYPPDMLKYLIIFVPIIILYFIFDSALNGLMMIKISVIIKQTAIYGNFIVFTILFLFNKDFFRDHLWAIIWGSSFVLYTILGLLVFTLTAKKMKYTSLNTSKLKSRVHECSHANTDKEVASYDSSWSFRTVSILRNFKLYLPKRFWSFALFVHALTIIGFAYDKIDQLLIVSYFGIHELGLYYAALQTATLIRFVPMLIGSVILPSFSNLLASNEINLIQKGYREVIRYNTLMIVPVSLFCIFFSRQVMGLYGEEYMQNHLMLVVLGICFMVSSFGTVAPSLIIIKGRTDVYLLNSFLQIIFQLIIMLFLIDRMGVFGLVIGRGAGVVLAQPGLIFIACRLLDMDIKIPRAYTMSVVTAIATVAIYFIIHPIGLFISVILFLVCLVFFLYFGEYSSKDIDFILRQWREKQHDR